MQGQHDTTGGTRVGKRSVSAGASSANPTGTPGSDLTVVCVSEVVNGVSPSDALAVSMTCLAWNYQHLPLSTVSMFVQFLSRCWAILHGSLLVVCWVHYWVCLCGTIWLLSV